MRFGFCVLFPSGGTLSFQDWIVMKKMASNRCNKSPAHFKKSVLFLAFKLLNTPEHFHLLIGELYDDTVTIFTNDLCAFRLRLKRSRASNFFLKVGFGQ